MRSFLTHSFGRKQIFIVQKKYSYFPVELVDFPFEYCNVQIYIWAYNGNFIRNVSFDIIST